MRFFLILALIGGLGWYGYNALTKKESLLGSAVKDHTERSMKLSDSAERAAAAAARIPPVETVGSADVQGSGHGGAQSSPVLPPPASSVYVFQHREPPAQSELQALTSFGIVVAVDRATRTVLVQGQPASLDAAVAFLSAMDQVSGGCAVQTWAVFVDRSVTKGFDLAAAIKSVSNVESSLDVGNGGFVLDVGAGDVAVAINAIADGSSVEVVQRPHVKLSHGIPARIESTQEYPVPMTTVSNGLSQSSIQYRKVGLQLEVTPYFTSRDRVRLTVNQVNGLIGNTVQIEGNAIPVIQSQTVATTAEMTVGQTIILGGVTTQRVRTVRGILRNSREMVEGALYVVLSTYEDVPKASPVGRPPVASPAGVHVPFALPMDSPADWIDGHLLPEKGWEAQERDFVRSRIRKGGLK